MIVVADSSPLIVLAATGHLALLPSLFENVMIPPEVAEEISRPATPESLRRLVLQPPEWLEIRTPRSFMPISLLDPGETAAIWLAVQLGIEVVLIDEKKGRREATRRGLRALGAIGVLELGAAAGLIDLASAFDRVRETDFRIPKEMLDARLRLFQQQQRERGT